MSARLTFDAFLRTAPGERLRAWENARFDETVSEAFGGVALQVGGAAIDALHANPIRQQWLLDRNAPESRRDDLGFVRALPEALPVATESVDLVVLPHTLDFAEDPETALAEAVRVLAPEGRLVLSAFNPLGLWWLRERSRAALPGGDAAPYLPSDMKPTAIGPLKEALLALGMRVDRGRFGVYSPALDTTQGLNRWAWLDKAGDRWAPHCANLYVLSAVKRTPGARLIDCTARRCAPERGRSEIPVASSSSRKTAPKEPGL